MAITANAGEYKSVIGLDSVYVAKVLSDTSLGYIADMPEILAPAAEISMTPVSSQETQYANNQPYDIFASEAETDMEITLTGVPSSMRAQLLGSKFDAMSGRVFDNAGIPPYMALGFRTLKSNGKYRFYWFLKVKFVPPEEGAVTRADKATPKTIKFICKAIKTVYKWDLGTITDSLKRIYGDDDTTNFTSTGWFSQVQCPSIYYVDNSGGNDAYDGLDQLHPWKSLIKVEAATLKPFDQILFKCVETWSGSGDEGSVALTITCPCLRISHYDPGALPVIQNHPIIEMAWNDVIGIETTAHHTIIDGIKIFDSHYRGINAYSDYNIIKNCETEAVGIGISFNGNHNLAEYNYCHDGTMVVNTPTPITDNFGAVGIWIFSNYNEVRFNRLIRCRAVSTDYGWDGGAVEVYGTTDHNRIHHNYAEECEGFLEGSGFGPTEAGYPSTAIDNKMYYNVIVNCGTSLWLHLDTLAHPHGYDDWSFYFENNTVIDTLSHVPSLPCWYGCEGDPGIDGLYIRNNIIYLGTNTFDRMYQIPTGGTFTHENNLYYWVDPIVFGAAINQSEYAVNPMLTNLLGGDYTLTANSFAIEGGMDLGLCALDYAGNTIESPPEIGAYEAPGLPAPPPGAGLITQLGAALTAYWKLDETIGVVAADSSGNGFDGTYIGLPTLNDTPALHSGNAPYFDGTNDYVDIFSAGLAAVFNAPAGTVSIWAKPDIGEFTTADVRFFLNLRVDVNNKIQLNKDGIESVSYKYCAGGVDDTLSLSPGGNPLPNTTDWIHYLMTWDKATDEFKIYNNGIQRSITVSPLGVWVGALINTGTYLGSGSAGAAPYQTWKGWLAGCLIMNRVATGMEITNIYKLS